MNLRLPGLIVGIVGVCLLTVSLVIGGVMGANSRTLIEYWNMDDSSEPDEKKANKASEANALLYDLNMGIVSLGLGLIIIGGGLAIAKQKRGNWAVLGLAVLTALVLIIGLFLSIFLGVTSMEAEKIENKEESTGEDEKRVDEISENNAFWETFNRFFSGFLFGSLGIGLALMTILIGAFLEQKGPESPIPGSGTIGKDTMDIEVLRLGKAQPLDPSYKFAQGQAPQIPTPPPARPPQYAPPQPPTSYSFPPPVQQQPIYDGFSPPSRSSGGATGIDDLFR